MDKIKLVPEMQVVLITKPTNLSYDNKLKIGGIYIVRSIDVVNRFTEDYLTSRILSGFPTSAFESAWIRLETVDGIRINDIYPSDIFAPVVNFVGWNYKTFALLKQVLWEKN